MPPLKPLLSAVAEGAVAIESVFLSAGEGLGRGLDAFRSLTADLAALGTEHETGSLATAADGLTRMTDSLRQVGDRLPVEGRLLDGLLDTNKGLMRRFDDLIGDMRMMVVVSRSARLEAVASDDQRVSLEDFSRTIDEQIGAVQRRIDHCASDHRKLTLMLDRAGRDHLAFDLDFGARLAALAGEIDDALSTIGRRRAASLALMGSAAARARAIGQAAGTALVSLQVGDNTRQRLEHIHHALAQAEALQAGHEPSRRDAAIATLLCRLGDAQLRDTVAGFESESAGILETFALLGRETAGLVAASRATEPADDGTARSALQLQDRLTDALDIVGACDASRRSVAGAITGLRALLDTLDDTLAALLKTSDEMIIVAMNVGLKAGRLGTRGRGLVSVAAELKRLSSQISAHAAGLLEAFGTVRRDAALFGPEAGEEETSLAAETRAILGEIARGDARAAGVLASVDRSGRAFEVTVARAAEAFEAAVADTVRLTAVADRIGELGADAQIDGETRRSAVAAIDDMLLPLYSMAQERDIHASVLGTARTASHPGVEDWAA